MLGPAVVASIGKHKRRLPQEDGRAASAQDLNKDRPPLQVAAPDAPIMYDEVDIITLLDVRDPTALVMAPVIEPRSDRCPQSPKPLTRPKIELERDHLHF